jgi:hypothetical protein
MSWPSRGSIRLTHGQNAGQRIAQLERLHVAEDGCAVGAALDTVNASIAALHVEQNVLMHGNELDPSRDALDSR